MRSRFASVVLDVDSTLTGIEGIDWLGRLRLPHVAERIAKLTAAAMTGEKTLSEVYAARLELVRPMESEIRALGDAYLASIAPGAVETVRRLREAGVKVVLVTSGVEQAVFPLADRVGIPRKDVYAVPLEFDGAGSFLRVTPEAMASVKRGKRLIVEQLALPRPALAVGDGITDAELKPVVDAFAAFVGFVRREPVVARADHVVASFEDVERLVLAQ